ncbi:hypothetical protein ABW20_dc0103409 [Dactylellina cionopaga]|nr:hypothetical protein ABW20_dc0103409 [Dactylellina cionopaga]
MIAKGGRIASSSPDLSKMPEMMKKPGGNMAPPIIPRQGGRDRILGQTVHVRQGPYKGLLGIVKDATDTTARVELHTKSKTITIDKTKLGFKEGSTGRILSYAEFVQPKKGFGGAPSYSSSSGGSAWSGSRTPAGAGSMAGSRTPAGAHGASGGRTPAWAGGGDGGRTPAWASGSKTPAYNDGSRTSDPYRDGSRTSNPYKDGSRTSDPYRGDNDGSRTSYGQTVGSSGSSGSSGSGGRTPAWNPGNRTPHHGSGESAPRDSGSAWDSGSKTPARSLTSINDQWNDSYSGNASATARTPAAYNATSPEFSGGYTAATPGASGLSAATPGGLNPPTPAPVSAPTPRANVGPWDAPTPGGPVSAATPGASGDNRRGGYYDAPTPQGYSSAKTPGANWGNDDDDEAPGYS